MPWTSPWAGLMKSNSRIVLAVTVYGREIFCQRFPCMCRVVPPSSTRTNPVPTLSWLGASYELGAFALKSIVATAGIFFWNSLATR